MIASTVALQALVDSNPEVGAYISRDQARWLDQALCWSEVEEIFSLEECTLTLIYEREEPMSQEVLEVLWELNGGGPVTESEEDIWL